MGKYALENLTALNNGCGLSALLFSGFRAISLLAFNTAGSDTNQTLLKGAFLFFGISLAVNIITIIMFSLTKPWEIWPEAQRWTEAEINKSLSTEINLQAESFS